MNTLQIRGVLRNIVRVYSNYRKSIANLMKAKENYLEIDFPFLSKQIYIYFK